MSFKGWDKSDTDVIGVFRAEVEASDEVKTWTADAWPYVPTTFPVVQQAGLDEVTTTLKFTLPAECPKTRIDLSKMDVKDIMEHLAEIEGQPDSSDDSPHEVSGEALAQGATEVEDDAEEFCLDNHQVLIKQIKESKGREQDKFRTAIQALGSLATLANIKQILKAADMNEGTVRGMTGASKAEKFGWSVTAAGLYFVPEHFTDEDEEAVPSTADRPSASTRGKGKSRGASSDAPAPRAASTKVGKRPAEASASAEASPAPKKARGQAAPSSMSNKELHELLEVVRQRAKDGLVQLLNTKLVEFLTSNPRATPAEVDEFRVSVQKKIVDNDDSAVDRCVEMLQDRLA